MAKTVTTRFGVTRWSAGTDTVARTDFDTAAANIEARGVVFAEGAMADIPAAGQRGRIFRNTDGATNNDRNRVFWDTGSTWISIAKYAQDQFVEPSTASTVASVIRGKSGNNLDVFRVEQPTGTVFLRGTNNYEVSTQSVAVGEAGSGGVYLGSLPSHQNSLIAVSISAAKAVGVFKGAVSQTAALIEARTSGNTPVFTVSPAGNVASSGSVQALSASFTNALTAGVVNAQNNATFGRLTISSATTAQPPLIVNGANGQGDHLRVVAYNGAGGMRVNATGDIATNTRVVVGDTLGTGAIDLSTYGSLYIKNSFASSPVAKFVGATSQAGNLIEAGTDSTPAFYVTPTGNGVFVGNMSSRSASIGSGNNSPTAILNESTPALDVVSGTGTGTYRDFVTIRHNGTSASAVSRKVTLALKLSDESNATESAKWAGIEASTSAASSGNPELIFYTAGLETARFRSAGTLAIAGINQSNTPNIQFNTDRGNGIGLNNANNVQIGVQPNSLYQRSPQAFYWYTGGSYNDVAGNAGGGRLSMTLIDTSENLLTVGKIQLTDSTSFDSTTPALSVGSRGGNHLSFTAASMNAYDGSMSSQTLNLGNNNPDLINMGGADTVTRFNSRVMGIGGNRVYFGGTSGLPFNSSVAGGGPNQNDWYFDHTNNRIMVRSGTNNWIVVAKDTGDRA